MKRHKGTFDIFFRIEHRMKKQEMEEQFNRPSRMEVCSRGSKDHRRECRQRGSQAHVGRSLCGHLPVVGRERERFRRFQEGRFAEAMGECWRRYLGFCRIFGHLEGWTPRNEAMIAENNTSFLVKFSARVFYQCEVNSRLVTILTSFG